MADLYQRAVLRRAMRAAGLPQADLPELHTLHLAERPPKARYDVRTQGTARPGDDEVREEAARLMRDAAWWRDRPVAPRWLHDLEARREAESRVLAAWTPWTTVHVLVNGPEMEAAAHRTARWGRTAEEAHAILDTLERHVPDLALASMPEDDLRSLAQTAASHWTEPTQALRQHGGPADITPTEARRLCPRYQLRRLRKRAAAARQHAAAILGTVGLGAAHYADAFSVHRWQERQDRARQHGETHVLRFDDGTTARLIDVMTASKKAAVAQVYATLLGIEELARERAMLPLFITLTLPPEWHPAPTMGAASWTPDRSPRKADQALQRLWQHIRATLAEEVAQGPTAGPSIGLLGMRVVEPHRDGCPHLHALLYVADEAEADRVDRVLQHLRPEPVPGRRIATRMETIDRGRASPCTYVMKYLVKSMSDDEAAAAAAEGAPEGHDEAGDGDHLAHHHEHRAWASERGLRRFAFLGVHGLRRIWQRLRTADEDELAGAPERVLAAHAALRDRRYGDALTALGAVRADRLPRIRLGYEEETIDPHTGEVRRLTTAYGDPVKRAAWMVDDASGWRLPLRRQGCHIERVDPQPEQGPITVVVSCPRALPPHPAPPTNQGRPGARGRPSAPRGPPPALSGRRRPMLSMDLDAAA